MIGAGKNQASQRPTAMGTMLQASTYGMAIPTIYGMTQSALLAIWAGSLRMGSGSTKKLKQFLKKQPVYVEGVDFLIGANPIMGVNQLWINGATIPLQLKTVTFSTFSFGTGTFTITDPYFYSVIGVTFGLPYSETFNDYGGQGTVTASGTAQVPLWNVCELGPDPIDSNASRYWPLCYRWQQSYGNIVYLDSLPIGGPLPGASTITVTYYALMPATSYESPLAKYRMAFENELGNGDEYSQNGATAEQIIYPMFAGVGSPDLDLGTSATMPQIQAEIKGKFGYWPTGDADFADMIEDIVKSGIAQAAIGASTTGTVFTGLEHGLSGYNFPGCVQKQSYNSTAGGPTPFAYYAPNTAGNFLVVVTSGTSGSTAGAISDSAGNTWTPVFASGNYYQVWYAKAMGGANTVTVSGFSTDWSLSLFEIAGVDTFDSASIGSAGNGSLTTTNASGYPAYLMGIDLSAAAGSPVSPTVPGWTPIVTGVQDNHLNIFERRSNYPGTFAITPPPGSWTPGASCILGFKCANPAPYPKPVSDFMDLPSLNLTRAQCRANGLYGSLTMNAQQAASDWLKMLYQAANAAPAFVGSKLYSFPLSEVSAAGNGAVYNAPTAPGPIANLSTENGDILSDGKNPPIKFNTKSRVNLPNVLQMQCISRTSNYNQINVEQPEAASIALYGVRKADPIVNNAVQDASIARMLLGIAVRKNQYGSDTFSFNMSSSWDMLSPMDLITITDLQAGINAVPVRLTSISEQQDGSLACEAEPFIYGMYAPLALPVSTQTPSGSNVGNDPGTPNTPIFIEAVPRLAGSPTQNQLWIAVSSGNANYAGCQAFVSTNGGTSYSALGDPIIGNGITGDTTADWPAAADPDTTNNLAVDLTESLGALASYPVSDEDAFKYPCYVAGGGSSAIPYELMTYALATLTAANKYTLEATGTGNHLRRAVFAAPAVGAGCDHPSGSRFAFLSPDGAGILKVPIDPAWYGVTLYFKFVPFNSFGGNGQQTLANATAYSFAPTGNPGNIGPAGGFLVNGS